MALHRTPSTPLFLSLFLAVAACGGGGEEVAPAGSARSQAAATPQVVALHVSPPQVVVAVGEQVALMVIVELDDGTVRPAAAAEVVETIDDSTIATLDNTVVSGVAEGHATLTVRDPLAPAVAAESVPVVVATRTAPVVERLGVGEASPGDLLPIFGSHLTSPLGDTTVTLAGLDAEVVEAGPQILVVRVPADAVGGAVAVTVAGRAAEHRPGLHVALPVADDPAANRYTVATGSAPGEVSIHFVVDLPDHTPVAVTAANNGSNWNGHRIESAGGEILAGTPAVGEGYGYFSDLPGDRYRILTVDNGEVVVPYSTGELMVEPTKPRSARVSLLPATDDGRVASRFALNFADITLVGAARGAFLVDDAEVVANATGDTVHFRLTDLRDGANRPLPDHTRIAITAVNNGCDWQGHRIESWGGEILGGEPATGSGYGYFSTLDGDAYRIFTVQDGMVEGDYTPDPVTVRARFTGQAMLQAVLARADKTIAVRGAVAITPISLVPPSADAAHATVAPHALFADGGDHRATLTVSGLAAPAGRTLPAGTQVAVTVADNGSDGGGYRVRSVGGGIVGGTPVAGSGFGYASNLDGDTLRLFPLAGGGVEIVYTDDAIALGTGETATARIQLLPADGNGVVIDNDAILVAEVTLAGATGGRIDAAGQGAPGEVIAYTATDLTDALGAPLSDESRLAVTVADHGSEYHGSPMSSAGGTLYGGAAAAEGAYGYRGDLNADAYQIFTVTSGSISGWVQLPAGRGTTLLQLLPATPDGHVIGRRAMAIRSVVVQ